MKTFENSQLGQSAERARLEEHWETRLEVRLRDTLEKIRETELFDSEYLETIPVVVFDMHSENKVRGIFRNATPVSVLNAEKSFSVHDFMFGKRTDFVGINSPEEFESFDPSALSDRQSFPFLFLSAMPSFEEFVAHEMAHNVFDRLYKEKYGEYKLYPSGITDVSDAYSKEIREKILQLWDEFYSLLKSKIREENERGTEEEKKYPLSLLPGNSLKKFDFSRQQIAEIFAQLYQREFCRRSGIHADIHNEVKNKVEEFVKNPKKKIHELNRGNTGGNERKREATLEKFFTENHVLSIIMAPIIEEKYPNFSERMEKVFGFSL